MNSEFANEAQLAGYWIMQKYRDRPAEECPCHGSGWICDDYDCWQTCGLHYTGGPDPETAGEMEREDEYARQEDAFKAANGYKSCYKSVQEQQAADEAWYEEEKAKVDTRAGYIVSYLDDADDLEDPFEDC